MQNHISKSKFSHEIIQYFYEMKKTGGELIVTDNDIPCFKITIIDVDNKKDPSGSQTSKNCLLKHAGKWEGNDFEDCLEDVYLSRMEAVF